MRLASALAVASVEVLLTVLDFGEHPCVSSKDFLYLGFLMIA